MYKDLVLLNEVILRHAAVFHLVTSPSIRALLHEETHPAMSISRDEIFY